jgi:Tfp pilus assembly protein PilO
MRLIGTKGRLLAGIGVFLGLLAVFYFLLYVPRVAYRESLRAQISRESTRLSQLLGRYRELEQLQAQHESLKNRVYQMEKAFKQDQATFLRELGRKGKLYGIDYMNIVPLESTEAEFYARTPVSIDLNCNYHSLGVLLSDMANTAGKGYFTVDSVLFREAIEPDYALRASMTMSLYDYKGVPLSVGNDARASAESGNLVSSRRVR